MLKYRLSMTPFIDDWPTVLMSADSTESADHTISSLALANRQPTCPLCYSTPLLHQTFMHNASYLVHEVRSKDCFNHAVH